MRPMTAYDPEDAAAPTSPQLLSASTLQDVTSQSREPARPASSKNALSVLIQRRKRELGLTWKELASKGGFSSHTIIYALATKTEHRSPPRLETLQRLARALEVPENVVRAAAYDAAGHTVQETKIPLSTVEDIRVIAAGAADMSEHDRAIVRNLVESILRQHRDARDDQ